MADVPDLSILDADVLQEWIVAQRWFGSKSREVSQIELAETVTLRTEPPLLVLALVEARFGEGTHETYQVPLGLRPAAEGWDERVIAQAGDWTVYDALADPAQGRELLHRIRQGDDVPVEDGMLRFRWAESAAAGSAGSVEVRPVGVEQSNSSVVFGEELILKAFRRVEPGVNPELELLRFLSAREFAHIAPLAGWYEVQGRQIDATLGILQEYLAGARDGWELVLDELAGGASVLLDQLHALGQVTGDLHSVLGSDPDDPGVRARGAERGVARAADRGRRRADRAHVPRPAGARRAVAARRARAGRARAAADALPHRRGRARDPHPRRLPPRPDHAHRPRLGDPRLRGRAGAAAAGAAPQALAAARRGGDAAVVLLRRRRRADPARRVAAGGLGGAGARAVPARATATGSTRACSRPASRRSTSCWRCSSSRRPSTSCATSSTTGPTGSASPPRASRGWSTPTSDAPS